MADLNFIWHGLIFEWRDPDTRFDNYNQPSDRWGTGVARPVGKLWTATLKFGHCEAAGGGDTPEDALDSAFRQIERDVAEVRDRMQDGSPAVERPMYKCSICSAPATRLHDEPDNSVTFYCNEHATPTESPVRECDMCAERATRWHINAAGDKLFYCDPHAAEIRARINELSGRRWGVL